MSLIKHPPHLTSPSCPPCIVNSFDTLPAGHRELSTGGLVQINRGGSLSRVAELVLTAEVTIWITHKLGASMDQLQEGAQNNLLWLMGYTRCKRLRKLDIRDKAGCTRSK